MRQRALDLAGGVLYAFVEESERVDERFFALIAQEARLGIAEARRLRGGSIGDIAESERG